MFVETFDFLGFVWEGGAHLPHPAQQFFLKKKKYIYLLIYLFKIFSIIQSPNSLNLCFLFFSPSKVKKERNLIGNLEQKGGSRMVKKKVVC